MPFMEETEGKTTRPGGGHLFWGPLFAIMGIMAFFRTVIMVVGVPLWAISFLCLGISHFLKAPRVHDLMRLDAKRADRLSLAAGILQAASLATLALSLIIAWSQA